jgi:hypothetical protein
MIAFTVDAAARLSGAGAPGVKGRSTGARSLLQEIRT